MKRYLPFIPFVLILNAFLLYSRSIPYSFVYDDIWRIVTNKSIQTLDNPSRFFVDRKTQASIPDLERDSYRPVVTLSFALDHFLFGLRPAGYRIENILIHGLNGVLVFLLAQSVLSLSAPAAVFSALLFLNHPVQTESVVWIVERTNVLGLFFLLLSLWAWVRSGEKKFQNWAWGTHVFLILSLLSREIAVVTPLFLFLIDYQLKREKKWRHYTLAMFEVIVFLIVRSNMLDQFSIAPVKGGDWMANVANVFSIVPLYGKVVFFPTELRITYSDLIPVVSFFQPMVILGCLLLGLFAASFIYSYRRDFRWSLAIAFILIFWLPGSNVVPLTTLFAERLLYPILMGFGWLGGLYYEKLKNKNLKKIYFGGVILFISALTWIHLPVWKNELKLWENAVQQAPEAWFAWACLGQEQQRIAGQLKVDSSERLDWYKKSEQSFEHALKNGPPVQNSGSIYYLLAKTKLLLGKSDEALSLSERAFELDSNLKLKWEKMLLQVK
jgi:hypothetical protein